MLAISTVGERLAEVYAIKRFIASHRLHYPVLQGLSKSTSHLTAVSDPQLIDQ